MLCLTITEKTIQDAVDCALRNREYVDLLELRIDYLNDDQVLSAKDFQAKVGIPVIATLRRKKDGGMFTGTEESRIAILKELVEQGGFDYVDIEDDVSDNRLEKVRGQAVVIRSFHDFHGVPEDLIQRLARMRKDPDDIVKAAVFPKNTEGLRRFMSAADYTECRKILVAMGVEGMFSRILSGKLGSYLSFTSESSAAPGHLSPQQMQELYRFSSISRATRVYGIAGNPVAHSLSPLIHNTGFAESGIDAVYVPFQTSDLPGLMEHADLLGIDGLSVTVPLKEQALEFAGIVSESASVIGAANTLVRQGDGFIAMNTDAQGFIRPLEELPRIKAASPEKAAVIGAGGAARAVVHALKKSGRDVCIFNRTLEKAEKLASEFGCKSAPLSEDSLSMFTEYRSIVVQTTSCGMEPDTEGDPAPFFRFSGEEIVCDIIYKPEKTRFLSRAEKAGCTVLNGLPMLIYQGFAQFSAFTGRDYPLSYNKLMERIGTP
ncbi:MAG: shikimate dehydrogenase [Spirochaetia bacterium]